MNEGGRHRNRGGPGQGGTSYKGREELGIKDDDRKQGRSSSWTMFFRGPKLRRRRVALAVSLLLILWLFISYRLSTTQWLSEAPSTPERPGFRGTGPILRDNWPAAPAPLAAPTGPPPEAKTKKGSEEKGKFSYDGELTFYTLPSSLQVISRTGGHRPNNRNILFAASNLQSAAVLIPIACDMANHSLNYVHFAIMGKSDLTFDEILDVNGVDKMECRLFWHDARPDYAAYSSDKRAELAVSTALLYIQNFMHPQAIVTDNPASEDAFFVRGLHSRTSTYNIPIIELPVNDPDALAWIAGLDSVALSAWHKPTIDILIQAQPESSGSLMRLLMSLYHADYSGSAHPRITIELPHEIDSMTQTFLSDFRWPPPHAGSVGRLNQLTVRRRIPSQRLSAEEASIRFLESFYPSNPTDNHVLLLSPRAQLSPLYFQYLKYHLLLYHYSTSSTFASHLLGISLEVPATLLDGTTKFEPPTRDAMSLQNLNRVTPSSEDFLPSFLWQAPNSNAALYFGSRWLELHSFLSHRLARFHSTPSAAPRPKLVSPTLPAWTEYALELMRARGLALLYPGRGSADAAALVTLHSELYVPPEEFLAPPAAADTNAAGPPHIDGRTPFRLPAAAPAAPAAPEAPLAPARALPALLPFAAAPDARVLPHLSAAGAPLRPQGVALDAERFAEVFRAEVGGCVGGAAAASARGRDGSAADLFCWGEGEGPFVEALPVVSGAAEGEAVTTVESGALMGTAPPGRVGLLEGSDASEGVKAEEKEEGVRDI